MNVDIYRRSEANDKFTYLIVPHGQEIPQEAANVDWLLRKREVHVDESAHHLDGCEIDEPGAQIAEKGYAITSIYHQVDGKAPSLP